MYESVDAKFYDIGCTWNAGHVICVISSSRVANLGRKKSAQNCHEKMKLCKTRPIKCISKTFVYLTMKKHLD